MSASAAQPVAVIGAPLDLGQGRRGVDMGPSAVNPILDRENETARLAVELVASALGARIL